MFFSCTFRTVGEVFLLSGGGLGLGYFFGGFWGVGG